MSRLQLAQRLSLLRTTLRTVWNCAASLLLVGCVVVDLPYNRPSREKLRLESPAPQAYIVRVANKTHYSVGADGRVIVDVPPICPGSATYLFGVIKVAGTSPYQAPAICLEKNGRVVRQLSLNMLMRMPVDSRGYRLVKAE